MNNCDCTVKNKNNYNTPNNFRLVFYTFYRHMIQEVRLKIL